MVFELAFDNNKKKLIHFLSPFFIICKFSRSIEIQNECSTNFSTPYFAIENIKYIMKWFAPYQFKKFNLNNSWRIVLMAKLVQPLG